MRLALLLALSLTACSPVVEGPGDADDGAYWVLTIYTADGQELHSFSANEVSTYYSRTYWTDRATGRRMMAANAPIVAVRVLPGDVEKVEAASLDRRAKEQNDG